MDELITIEINENNEQAASTRELHEKLGIQKDFSAWFKYQVEKLGLREGYEFTPILGKTSEAGGRPSIDYAVPLDIAKHICMVSGGEKAHAIREYFIQVERAWNSPEEVMARGLKIANKCLNDYKNKLQLVEAKVEQDKPKVLFAESVSASSTSILVADLARLIKQNGIDIGEIRLWKWLRDNGYVIKEKGRSYNSPTQKSMNLEIMEVKESTRISPQGESKIERTTLINGKGQIYFINKFKSEIKEEER